MSTKQWTPEIDRLTSVEALEAEWQKGLALKGSGDLADWERAATRVREAAALLRDSIVPVGSVRERLVALVEDMSKHLPERRTARRPE